MEAKEDNQLHIAVENGDLGAFQSLLGQENIVITRNNQGRNPLDIAIAKCHTEIAEYISGHPRWREFVHDGCTDTNLTQLQLMVLKMPKVAESFLDRCVEQKCDSERKDEIQVTYDFLLLYGMSKDKMDCANNLSSTLKVLVCQKNDICLTHPVCVAYLKDFWLRVGFWVFLVNFIFYLIFLTCLTSLALLLQHRSAELVPLIHCLRSVVIILSCVQLLKEAMQIFSQRWCYFTRLKNWVEVSLYSISIFSIIHYGKHADNETTTLFLRGSMAFSVFLAYSNIFLYMRSSFTFGTYIVMMLNIVKTLLRIVVLLLPFVCAYGIPFYIIFSIPEVPPCADASFYGETCTNKTEDPHYNLFNTLPLSIWTTFMLLLGEMKYPHTLYKYQPIPFPAITYTIYITMVLCMPIIVKNLLIGLSVGDIKRIIDQSRRTHFLSQVEMLIDIEVRLPSFIRRRIFVDHVTEYPFRKESFKRKFMSTGFPTITKNHDSAKEERQKDVKKIENAIITLTSRIQEQDKKMNEMLCILREICNSKTKQEHVITTSF